MKHSIQVSIGIPAYNEARNIKKLLHSLLEQKEDGITIREIIVVSDGSTDQTPQKVKEIKDKRIIFMDDKKRLGKSVRLNQIFQSFTGDILFLVDADITILDNELMAKTVRSVALDKSGIIGINALPLPATTFFEQILEAGVSGMKETAKHWRNGNNYLSFKGCFLAMDGKLARSIQMPMQLVNNDAYLYFSAIQGGYTPKYLENSSVFYRSPMTFTDHIKQTSRFQSSRLELEKYFTLDWEKEYNIPTQIIVDSLVRTFLKRPITTSAYLGINFYSKLRKQKNIKSTWSIASSTKSNI